MSALQDTVTSPCCIGRDYPCQGIGNKQDGLRIDASMPSCSGRQHAWRYCSTGASPEQTGNSLEQAFERNPHAAAQALAAKLSPAQRAVLAAALAQHTEMQQLDNAYWEELFQAHDVKGDSPGALDEFQAAMLAHTSLVENRNKTPPSSSALKMVFLASAIPFIGFGFLDNAIMLVAGEEIDNLLGLRFGLSTLASAGLGNAVADVIGVGAAKYIEQVVRMVPFVKEPKLSRAQQAMPRTQKAKLAGAMVGVLIGCTLGLTPLFVSGSFFTVR
ncbi:hypothetical protein VOLCADRAFT_56190 [Volvox carteri f. nagariensis]|uniref:Uncharacterized protein ssa13 n=1 Tax=Volvox carteri f. nagariensis TaxID=3068 RepID=D8TK72_VOLCA|nr:uncharacterized protein VOLCADRAFT_56190 [Volvox carteri f. nagariensis]EFJ52011.1 hypothetical protein VOLCADRAFT_56190 [Volvox carteri f. nagariensis]|eukprot:XP_002946785.1 hypothetical protein VOLCADRAFT_56190 [Volvox carteri f. nagariensis]